MLLFNYLKIRLSYFIWEKTYSPFTNKAHTFEHNRIKWLTYLISFTISFILWYWKHHIEKLLTLPFSIDLYNQNLLALSQTPDLWGNHSIKISSAKNKNCSTPVCKLSEQCPCSNSRWQNRSIKNWMARYLERQMKQWHHSCVFDTV